MPLLAMLALLPIFCGQAQAAGKARPEPQKVHANAGQTVKTEYFSVTLPAGWIMPEAINRRKPALSAVFYNQKTGIAITVNVLDMPIPARDLAQSTLKSMRAGGLKPAEPVKSGEFYKIAISGRPQGEAWFAGNGKICAATVILGEKMNRKVANEFLRVFRPVDKALFPAGI